jgi:hypothetical protein
MQIRSLVVVFRLLGNSNDWRSALIVPKHNYYYNIFQISFRLASFEI